jgi:NCS2 family nucleobase:cation symporter-2
MQSTVGTHHHAVSLCIPTVDVMTTVTLCVVMVVIMIEGVGQFLALSEVVERPLEKDDIARGLRADGVGAIVGGIFNTFTYLLCAEHRTGAGHRGTQPLGLRNSRGNADRDQQLSQTVFHRRIHSPVCSGRRSHGDVRHGGSHGRAHPSHVDFVENRKNAYIVAISLAMGMIPLVADRFFMRLPDLLAKFCQNGILLGTFTAVLLNVLFNASASQEPSLHALEKAA